MQLVPLTGLNSDVWIDLAEICGIEKERRPNTTLVLPDEKPYLTAVNLRNGRTYYVMEFPTTIIALRDESY